MHSFQPYQEINLNLQNAPDLIESRRDFFKEGTLAYVALCGLAAQYFTFQLKFDRETL
jgi:hypothetical protein